MFINVLVNPAEKNTRNYKIWFKFKEHTIKTKNMIYTYNTHEYS